MALICSSCGTENSDGVETCFGCGTTLTTVIKRGTLLASRYEILSPLGKGGMGMVYKAHDRVLDETVAIKVLLGDIAQDPDVAHRFRSEIKLARKVSHRNVCRIHEYGQAGGLSYISMEFVDGVDLRQVIRQKGALPLQEALDMAIQLGTGLQAIHEVGVIHRDLKTTNIMRDSKGLVRLMDFGIAKQGGVDGTTGVTARGQVVGTPEYMSPEQARGAKVDFRTDIYALGVVIFEMVTGRVPFRADTPLATLLMHLNEPPPFEAVVTTGAPKKLVDVLRRALAKDPAQRYGTAHELVEALRQAQTPALPATAPASPATHTGPEPAPTTPLPTVVPKAAGATAPTARPPATTKGLGGEKGVGGSRFPALVVAPGALLLTAGAILLLRAYLTKPSANLPARIEESPPAVATTASPATTASGAVPPTVMKAEENPSPLEAKTPTSEASVLSAKPRIARPSREPARASPAGEAPPGRASATTSPEVANTPKASVASTAPEQPAPALPGTLVLGSTPAAAVTLDGTPKGRTPTMISPVAAGRHALLLTTDDGRTLEEEISMSSGAMVERNHRFPGFGSLSITSDVWLNVSVDGGDTKTTPRRIEHLVAGRHVVRASRTGYKEKAVDVKIQEGETLRLNITLEREPGGNR